MKTILSGMRPTGRLHIGHLMGVLKNWTILQEKYQCFFMVADYHALTTPTDYKQVANNTIEIVCDWLAAGINPEKSVIFLQSQVPEHAELSLLLGMFTPLGWLLRCPTYKEQIRRYPNFQNLGLLNYPVLQAADILIYKAELVPVGKDQVAHIEMAREIARTFNQRFGFLFPEPQALLSKTPKVMALNRPNEKMSKSYGEENCIYLSDSPKVIKEKIRKAVTDVGPSNKMSAGVSNLFYLMELFSEKKTLLEFKKQYRDGTIRYQKMKEQLSEDIIKYLKPINRRREKIKNKISLIKEVLQKGSQRAQQKARETLNEVKRKIGLVL